MDLPPSTHGARRTGAAKGRTLIDTASTQQTTSPDQPDHMPVPAIRRVVGWLPCTVVAVASIAVLYHYGVTPAEIAAFAAYSLLGITLPGLLLWRVCAGRAGLLATDVAVGTALGLAIEIPVYALARLAGVPLATGAWPILMLMAFVLWPRLRRHWRGSGRRLPWPVAWASAAFMLYMLAVTVVHMYRTQALTGPRADSPYVDVPFHLALIGELKNHFPPQTPYLIESALDYHWYFHAHAAAASWLTGIEPLVLLDRLLSLPLLYMLVMLIVGIGHRLTRRWWPGLLAVGLSIFALGISPYRWSGAIVGGSLLDPIWFSPTQDLGAALFAALVFILIDVLGSVERVRRAVWFATFLLIGAVSGAKSTYVPVLAVGLGLLGVVRLLVRRRPGRALTGLGLTAMWWAFAQFILFGAGTGGMKVAPLHTTQYTAVSVAAIGAPAPDQPWSALIILTAFALVGLLVPLAAAIGLLRLWPPGRGVRRARAATAIDTPAVAGGLLLIGLAAAGVGALFAFGHPGLSQYYFLRAAMPYIALLAACGFAALVDARLSRRAITLLGVAAIAGLAVTLAVRGTVGAHRPAVGSGVWPVIRPFAALLVALIAVAVVIGFAGRRLRLPVRTAFVAVAVALAVPALVPGYAAARAPDVVDALTGGPPAAYGIQHNLRAGSIEAARWLREHSDPDDMVATNSHCLPSVAGICDSRDFWISGYAERRVLIEGWMYTERADDELSIYKKNWGEAKYWNPALLAANNIVFSDPTEANVAYLRDHYHVRWLVAIGHPSPALATLTTLRYTTDGIAIYEINR